MRLKQRERERLNRKYHLEDEIARMLARLYMSRECTRVDGQGKNSFDTKRHSQGCPGQQLPPYSLPTHDVEALGRSYGREVIPPLGNEWTANR